MAPDSPQWKDSAGANVVGPAKGTPRFLGIWPGQYRVRLVFDSDPVLLSVDDVKLRVSESFKKSNDAARRYLGMEKFNRMLEDIESAATVSEIFETVTKAYYVPPHLR